MNDIPAFSLTRTPRNYLSGRRKKAADKKERAYSTYIRQKYKRKIRSSYYYAAVLTPGSNADLTISQFNFPKFLLRNIIVRHCAKKIYGNNFVAVARACKGQPFGE